MAIGQDLLNVPFPEMIESMGVSIAQAQFSLDEVGIRLAQMMSGEYEIEIEDPRTGEVTLEKREAYVSFNGEKLSLLELGFTPTFYQFTDTVIEVKVSLSMSRSSSFKKKSSTKTKAGSYFFLGVAGGRVSKVSSVSASYAAKYQYTAEGASMMRTKLVPIPPPVVLEERIRGILDAKEEETT